MQWLTPYIWILTAHFYMRKLDLINDIAEQTNLSRIDVIICTETFINCIQNTLEKGDNVHLRGFGSFIVRKRNAKKGRDIQNKTEIEIPAHYVPVFKPSKEFTAKLKQLKDETVAKYARKNSKNK